MLFRKEIVAHTAMNQDKRFRIGMYGGKFLPFHKGHDYCVRFAAHECETVYVLLFWGGADEERIRKQHPESWLSVDERACQLRRICKNNSHLAYIVPSLIDISELRLPDGSENWDAETPLVRSILGDHLDAVYSSEQSYGSYFKRAYPEAVHRLVDIHRTHYPISGTMIRSMTNEEDRTKWTI